MALQSELALKSICSGKMYKGLSKQMTFLIYLKYGTGGIGKR
jgi:hypothetical protein